MKSLMVLLVSGLLVGSVLYAKNKTAPSRTQVQSEAQNKTPYEACTCNFNNCMGQRSNSCVQFTRCDEITADQYAQVVGNHKTTYVINARAYCVDYSNMYMRQ